MIGLCRLYMLQEQCKSWMGITSVAVYWPLICFQPNNTANLDEAIGTVKQFHQQMEAAGGILAIALRLLLQYVEVVKKGVVQSI